MRKCSHKLRFRSAFQTETERPAGFQDLLNDFVQLIYFDGIDANIRIPVAGFFNSFAKGSVELGYAGTKQILKTDEKRKLNSLLPQILNDFVNVDADRIAQDRPYCEVTFFIHIEVGFTPQLDSVKILRIFDGPDIFLRYL